MIQQHDAYKLLIAHHHGEWKIIISVLEKVDKTNGINSVSERIVYLFDDKYSYNA